MTKFFGSIPLLFLPLLPTEGNDLTIESATTLESAIQKQIPGIRAGLVKIGRTSIPDFRPGVILSESGHILCPHLPPIDGVPVPYLIYGENGARFPLETIWEDENVGLAVVQSKSALAERKRPVALAPDDSFRSCSWLLVPGFPPAVLPGDEAQLHLAHLLSAPTKADPSFSIGVRARIGGLPVFDLAGRLVAVTASRLPTGNGFNAMTISGLVDRFPDLSEQMPPVTEAMLPKLPYYIAEQTKSRESKKENSQEPERPNDPARDALGDLAMKATAGIPTVAVFNHAGVSTTGIHGLIIAPDGLILTKASEIGATPVVQFGEESFPAVLLATDESTDLALLSIEANQLPTVQWSDSDPGEGTLVHSPQIHTAPPFDPATTSGLLSHKLAAHPAASLTVHSPEQTTSLGIVPEHDLVAIRIAAIFPGGPAARAGLKRGDLLVSVNGTPMPNRNTLRSWLSERKVGDKATLLFNRDGKEQPVSVTLGAAHLRLPVTEPMIGKTAANMIITPPSIRRSGFPETFVHDLVIEHWQNGSPLCDSRGRVLGINIATVTYDRTLALPVPAIQEAIARMLATPVSF